MKECCQCGCVGETGFVTYCDECYDSSGEEGDASIQELQDEVKMLREFIEEHDMGESLRDWENCNKKEEA